MIRHAFSLHEADIKLSIHFIWLFSINFWKRLGEIYCSNQHPHLNFRKTLGLIDTGKVSGQFYQMKRQAYYLPNLNTILTKNRHHMQHQQRLKQATSHYHQPHDSMNSPAGFRREPSPFEKRQLREQMRENIRMSKAMEDCSPTVVHLPRKKHEAYESLKQRIRKFTTEGSTVTYKYQKSLLQFEKQQQSKEQYWSQRNNELHDKAADTSIIDANLRKDAENLKGKTSVVEVEHNDIFYKDCDSLYLYSAAPRKLTLNPPRSLTPQSFIYHSETGKGRTEKLQVKSRQRFQSKMSKDVKARIGLSEKTMQEKTRYRSQLYSQMSKSIKEIILGKISRTMNPEKQKKRRIKTLMDMEIIEIPSIN